MTRPGVAARQQAVRILCRVLGEGCKLSEALEQQADKLTDARDRALCKGLCFGVLRWLPRLEWLHRQLRGAGHHRDTLVLRCALYIGLYQLDHLQVPDHAAVSTSVELCRAFDQHEATGLLNALLRRYLREREAIHQCMAQHDIAQHAHSRWWLDTLRQAWPDDWCGITEANNRHPPLHLRVNRLRQSRTAFLDTLAQAGLRAVPSPNAPAALRLDDALPIQALPGYDQGHFAVQDVSAQLTAEVLPIAAGARVLDACAAPGGKTGLLLERWPHMATLVAVDRRAERMARLISNLQRLGHLDSAQQPARHSRIELVQAEIQHPETWWDGQAFDAILLDAPCSGSGIIRRQPDIKSLRRKRHLAGLTSTQRQLLHACWGLLKPGGCLLYATCSVLPVENSSQIATFLQQQADCVLQPIQASWGRDTGAGTQLVTGHQGMDGFFYALLKKSPHQPDTTAASGAEAAVSTRAQ